MKIGKSIIAHREFNRIPDGVYELKVKQAEVRHYEKGDRIFAVFTTTTGAIVSESWPIEGEASKLLQAFAAVLLGEGTELTDTDQLVGKKFTATVSTGANDIQRVFARKRIDDVDAPDAAKPTAPDAPVTE